jgi:molecular chaperone GrpE
MATSMSEDSTEDEAGDEAGDDAEVVEVELTPEQQIVALQKAVEKAESELTYKEADIVNLRRRHAAERSEALQSGAMGMARRMLPALDACDRALSTMPEDANDALAEGFRMTRSSLWDALEGAGVSAMNCKDGGFDPSLMEAISTIPAEEGQDSGIVVEVLEEGYMFNGKILRPARVVVTSE